jgi:hypothetical protein
MSTTEAPAPLLYTAEQAALRLGVDDDGHPIISARWLARAAGAGEIPHTRIGKRFIRFSEADLMALIERNACDPSNGGRKRRTKP